MKIVVTGGTGFLGSAIVSALRRSGGGHEVVSVARSPDVDIARPETVAGLVSGADAVVHAAIDAKGDAAVTDRRFVEAVLGMLRETRGLRRFVYTSGLWVLGDTGGRIADEASSAANPARAVGWRPSVERLVEQASARGDVDGWVVRPAIVYGGAGGIVGGMFESFERTGAVSIVGDGQNHWPLIHRDDLGELDAQVLERAPSQRILHATDGSDLSVRRGAGAVARAAGGDAGAVVTTPLERARLSMGDFADALALDQRVSSELTRRILGFAPRHRSLVDEAPALARERQQQLAPRG